MRYAVEMVSVSTMHIASFLRDCVSHPKFDGETHRQHGHLISLLSYFKYKESRLKSGHAVA
jgi:hypothetical protein